MFILPNRTNSVAPTTAQLAVIKTEASKPVYNGMAAADIARQINDGVSAPNPVARPDVYLPSVPRDKYLSIMYAIKTEVQATNAQSSILPLVEDAISYVVDNGMQTVYLTTGIQALLEQQVTLGIVTQTQLDKDLMEPDPAWKANVQTVPPVVLFPGQRVVLEASDVTTALAS